MPQVIFKFDKEKNIWNIWDTANFKPTYGADLSNSMPKKVREVCQGKTFQECKNELKDNHKRIHSSKVIPILVDAINKSWMEINDEFFSRLQKIMKKKIKPTKFEGYLTTVGRCPYDYKDNFFFYPLNNPILNILKTAGHEIMHIHFHQTYWKEVEKEIGKEKTGDLKEALTVLLNLEFKDLWFVEDQGYPNHDKLRDFISKQWKKEKDFDVLLKKSIKWIKNHPDLKEK